MAMAGMSWSAGRDMNAVNTPTSSGLLMGDIDTSIHNGGLTVPAYPQLNNGNPITIETAQAVVKSSFPYLAILALAVGAWFYGKRG